MHAQLARALGLASRVPEIVSVLRGTGEDCLIFDAHCPQAGRLVEVVDALARFGPVTTSLVLRAYPPKPLADVGRAEPPATMHGTAADGTGSRRHRPASPP